MPATTDRRQRGHHLKYAPIVATIALMFSLSGGAPAATHYLITSTKQISPNVLKRLKGARGSRGPQGLTGPNGNPGSPGRVGAPDHPAPQVAPCPSPTSTLTAPST